MSFGLKVLFECFEEFAMIAFERPNVVWWISLERSLKGFILRLSQRLVTRRKPN